MAASVPVHRAADGTATKHIQSAGISQYARADEFRMNRRAFIALVGGGVARPLAARAADTRDSRDRIFYQFGQSRD